MLLLQISETGEVMVKMMIVTLAVKQDLKRWEEAVILVRSEPIV